MMNDHFHQALVDCDINVVRKLWTVVFPHLPSMADTNDDGVLITIHAARAQMENMPMQQRAYSHRWLCDRGLRSTLPEPLWPKAERIYPKIVHAVGISTKNKAGAAVPIYKVMHDAAMDCYAEGDTDGPFVRSRILEARAKEKKKLFG